MLSDPNDTQTPPSQQLPPVRHRVRRPVEPPPSQPEPKPPIASAPEPEATVERATPIDDGGAAYRQPPRKYQFKPGQSGNPRGRPKGARSLPTLVDIALSKPVTAQMRGRTVKMTAREAMVMRYVEQAMKGDLKAFAVLLKLDPRAKHDEADAQAQDANQALAPNDQTTLLDFVRRPKIDDREDGQ